MRFTKSDDQPRVLISGAASGAGLACAEAFADRGAELILCDWDGIALTRAAKQLGAFSRFCDAGAERGVEIFVEEINSRFGSIDVLINAAGRGYVRALTMMRMARAAMPLLRKGSGYRLIANIAPAGGFSQRETIFPYAGSFASFARLSETLIEQCRGTEIDVACITPRVVRSKPSRDLRRISEETGGGYFELSQTADLAPTFTRVATGNQYTCALDQDGVMLCFGELHSSYGMLSL